MIRKAVIIVGKAVLVSTILSSVAFVALWIAGSYKLLRWEVIDVPDRFVVVAVVDGHMVLRWVYFTNLGGDEEQSFRKRLSRS